MPEQPRESFCNVKFPCWGQYGTQKDCPCIWGWQCEKDTKEKEWVENQENQIK